MAKVDGDGGLALGKDDLAEVGKIRKARAVKDQLTSAFGAHRFTDLGDGKWDLALNGQADVLKAQEILKPSQRLEMDRARGVEAVIPQERMVASDGSTRLVDARFAPTSGMKPKVNWGRGRILRTPTYDPNGKPKTRAEILGE